MTSDPVYYFIQPDAPRPVGGVNVALSFVNLLHKAGYQIAPLYGSASYSYAYAQCDVPAFYHPDLAKFPRSFMGRRQKAVETIKDLLPSGKKTLNTLLQPKERDVFVIPEYGYPEFCALFPQYRKILLAQDVFGFSRAFMRDDAFMLNAFHAIVTTSKASRKAVKSISGRSSHTIPLHVAKPGYEYSANKKLQIAYMPRKKSEDVQIVLSALKNRPALKGVEFVKIHNLSNEAVQKILQDSLIFLSFSFQEGFGLPPAEAMCAGCIVIGYTGVGGDEYFSAHTGFPIADSDVMQFADTVEAIIRDYQQDPTALDALRHRASRYIHDHYSFEPMHQALLSTWEQIHTDLADKNPSRHI